jgi:hypothetical protein
MAQGMCEHISTQQGTPNAPAKRWQYFSFSFKVVPRAISQIRGGSVTDSGLPAPQRVRGVWIAAVSQVLEGHHDPGDVWTHLYPTGHTKRPGENMA